MPRKRTKAVLHDGVLPVELTDVDDPAWESHDTAEEWFAAHGLELKPHPEWWTPVMFLDAAVHAWAIANGFGRKKYPRLVDWGRLREVGVPPTSTVKARFEWLTQVRVE